MIKKYVLLSALLLFGLAGCGSRALRVTGAWARPGSAGENSAVYFVIDNPTSQDDTLLNASSQAAAQVELHMSMMQDNDVMSMVPQERVPVPAGGQVTFEPGGLHVMLVDLQQDLRPGDRIEVNLEFENAGEMAVEAEVRE